MKKKDIFDFWKMAFDMGAIGLDMLHEACEVEDIDKEDYKKICNQNYEDYVKSKEA